MTCPNCGKSEIRVSHHPHSMDWLHRIAGRVPCRCRKCGHRFFASEISVPREADAGSVESSRVVRTSRNRPVSRFKGPAGRRRLLRRVITVAIFAIMFVIFWLFLRYLTTERPHSAESSGLAPFSLTPRGEVVQS